MGRPMDRHARCRGHIRAFARIDSPGAGPQRPPAVRQARIRHEGSRRGDGGSGVDNRSASGAIHASPRSQARPACTTVEPGRHARDTHCRPAQNRPHQEAARQPGHRRVCGVQRPDHDAGRRRCSPGRGRGVRRHARRPRVHPQADPDRRASRRDDDVCHRPVRIARRPARRRHPRRRADPRLPDVVRVAHRRRLVQQPDPRT